MEDAPAISDEADPLYPPLGGLEPWAEAPVDADRWAAAVGRLGALRAEDPDWGDMVDRGARLAAAYRSAALDGLYLADPDTTRALLGGEGAVAETAAAHVAANEEALRLAAGAGVSEAAIRRLHAVACGPQRTHAVWVGDALQDHVMAPGDYKHHPNHVRTAGGGWRPAAPVALVRPEMARVVATAASAGFAALHPVAQAAYLHDVLLHVQPFADGNGRVARALAGGRLLRDASIPLLVLDGGAVRGVEAVERAGLALVDHLAGLFDRRGSSAALARWRRQADARRAMVARLGPAMEAALERHRRRPDRPWGADLSGATVTTGDAVTVRAGEVVEVLAVDDGVVTAAEARLRHHAGDGGLDAWLDRVTSTLALRVAAALDDE